jgi:hypothetical protein
MLETSVAFPFAVQRLLLSTRPIAQQTSYGAAGTEQTQSWVAARDVPAQGEARTGSRTAAKERDFLESTVNPRRGQAQPPTDHFAPSSLIRQDLASILPMHLHRSPSLLIAVRQTNKPTNSRSLPDKIINASSNASHSTSFYQCLG